MHIHECKTCRRGRYLLMAGLIIPSFVCDRSRGLMPFLSASVPLLCSLLFSNMICHLLWLPRSWNRCHIWSSCSCMCLCTSADPLDQFPCACSPNRSCFGILLSSIRLTWKVRSCKDIGIGDFDLPVDSHNFTQTTQMEHIQSFLLSWIQRPGFWAIEEHMVLSMHASYILILVCSMPSCWVYQRMLLLFLSCMPNSSSKDVVEVMVDPR